MADSRPGLFRRIVFWSFVLLVAVMTGFRLFAPDTYWTSNPGWSYEIPLAFFYAILLAIGLQRWSVLGIAAWPLTFIALPFAFIAYHDFWRSSFWAYRLTIDVETPEGLKSGSSIAKVKLSDIVIRGFAFGCSLWSEATVVDLGARGRLIALLPRGNTDPCMVVPDLVGNRQRPGNLDDIHRLGRLQPRTLPVPADRLPIMIRFKDISGPHYDAERLDPAALDRSFGAGVRLKSVTVTLLDAGYWPFSSWRWPAFLAGVEVPRSRILETIPSLDVPPGMGLWADPCCRINQENFVQGESP